MSPHTCKFYNGDHHNKCCDAGVDYESVTTEPERLLGKAFRKPCVNWGKFKAGNPMSALQQAEWEKRGTCDKYTEPTPEEVVKYEQEMHAHAERMMKGIEATMDIRKKYKGQNWKGVIECPICKGRLHVSHAAMNGHVWGKCETVNCLAWME